MAHNDQDEIDFTKLEKELSNALAADKKYWRENDAKIRAVEQRVGSYEEFKGIVAASHLQPLDRKDGLITNERVTQTWNATASKNDQDVEGAVTYSTLDGNEEYCEVKTTVEFEKQWKMLQSSDKRYKFLCKLGGKRIHQLYKTEVSNLEGLLQVLHECYQQIDAQTIYNILYYTTKSDRFSLTIMFFGNQEKKMISALLAKLKECLASQDTSNIAYNESDLDGLHKKYSL